MRYMGGKTRLAKPITDTILSLVPNRTLYLEPFVGGGSVFAAMAPRFEWAVAGDLQHDLILMWNALLFEGWVPPESVSEDEYLTLRDSEPSPLRGFVGYGVSWGGRFFEGYARGANANYAATSTRSVLKFKDIVHKALKPSQVGRFRNQNYADWNPTPGTTIYCDPPYKGTKTYHSARSGLVPFDHEHFWRTMNTWVENGCYVFVSEYQAPPEWSSVWSLERKVSMDQVNKREIIAVEHLFTRVI